MPSLVTCQVARWTADGVQVSCELAAATPRRREPPSALLSASSRGPFDNLQRPTLAWCEAVQRAWACRDPQPLTSSNPCTQHSADSAAE